MSPVILAFLSAIAQATLNETIENKTVARWANLGAALVGQGMAGIAELQRLTVLISQMVAEDRNPSEEEWLASQAGVNSAVSIARQFLADRSMLDQI